MAEEQTETTSPTESTEERTISSEFSGVFELNEELRETVDEAPVGSQILFDEAGGSSSSRRDRAAYGEDYALRMGAGLANERKTSSTSTGTTQGLSSTSTADPFGPSRRDLAQRLDRLEGKVDALLAALDLDAGGE